MFQVTLEDGRRVTVGEISIEGAVRSALWELGEPSAKEVVSVYLLEPRPQLTSDRPKRPLYEFEVYSGSIRLLGGQVYTVYTA